MSTAAPLSALIDATSIAGLKSAVQELATLREAVKTRDITIGSLEAQLSALETARATDKASIKSLETSIAEFTKVGR